MNPAFQVYRKELREMFRDKRVRTSAFVVPILLIFGMLYLFGGMMEKIGKPENQKVTVVKSGSPLVDLLKKSRFDVRNIDSVARGQQLIRDGKAGLVLDMLPPDSTGQSIVNAYFDPKQQSSGITKSIVQGLFGKLNQGTLDAVLKAKGIPESAAQAIKLVDKPVEVGEGGGAAELIVSLLPYLIVIWAFYGGLSNASDIVAGEKEKMTLETLLITPVRRTEIVLGKFLALATICLTSSLSSLIGLSLYAAIKPPGSAEMLKNGLGVTPQAAATILVVLVPTVAFFASLLIAVSSYAKNSREAQTHLSLIGFLVTMPAIMSQFLGLTDMGSQAWVNFVPVLNTANSIRNALLGKTTLMPIVETVCVSLVLAAVALTIAVKLFNREEVLSRI